MRETLCLAPVRGLGQPLLCVPFRIISLCLNFYLRGFSFLAPSVLAWHFGPSAFAPFFCCKSMHGERKVSIIILSFSFPPQRPRHSPCPPWVIVTHCPRWPLEDTVMSLKRHGIWISLEDGWCECEMISIFLSQSGVQKTRGLFDLIIMIKSLFDLKK
jgi:hypothetical protein